MNAFTVSMSFCVHQNSCVWSILFLWNHPPPLAVIIFWSPLAHKFLSTKGMILLLHIQGWIFMVSHCFHIFWISVLINIYYRKLWWWGLSDVIIYGCNNVIIYQYSTIFSSRAHDKVSLKFLSSLTMSDVGSSWWSGPWTQSKCGCLLLLCHYCNRVSCKLVDAATHTFCKWVTLIIIFLLQ